MPSKRINCFLCGKRSRPKPITCWTPYVRFLGRILYRNRSVAGQTPHLLDLFAFWRFACRRNDCIMFLSARKLPKAQHITA